MAAKDNFRLLSSANFPLFLPEGEFDFDEMDSVNGQDILFLSLG